MCTYIFIFHIKELRIKDWFCAVLGGIYPFGMYLIFNYVCTGNPVFPYYNSIFKSVYFSANNFKDVRWGGTNLLEKIFWIVYAAFRPSYRQSEIFDFAPGTLIVGLVGTAIITILLGINFLREKRLKSLQNILYYFHWRLVHQYYGQLLQDTVDILYLEKFCGEYWHLFLCYLW